MITIVFSEMNETSMFQIAHYHWIVNNIMQIKYWWVKSKGLASLDDRWWRKSNLVWGNMEP